VPLLVLLVLLLLLLLLLTGQLCAALLSSNVMCPLVLEHCFLAQLGWCACVICLSAPKT
jgi:hypothetical protein